MGRFAMFLRRGHGSRLGYLGALGAAGTVQAALTKSDPTQITNAFGGRSCDILEAAIRLPRRPALQWRDAHPHPPAEDHLRRDARPRRSRAHFLLFWLSLQPLDDHERGCQACGKKGADVRPNFDWDKKRPEAPQACQKAEI